MAGAASGLSPWRLSGTLRPLCLILHKVVYLLITLMKLTKFTSSNTFLKRDKIYATCSFAAARYPFYARFHSIWRLSKIERYVVQGECEISPNTT